MTALVRYVALAAVCLFTVTIPWLYPAWLIALAVDSPACRTPCETPVMEIDLWWLPLLSVAGVWGLYIAMMPRHRRKPVERAR